MRYLVLIILVCTNISLRAQKLSLDNSNFFYEISPVFNFKKGIVSLTFDDGYLNQFKIGMPLLKSMNLPATFYVITGWIDSTLKKAVSDNLSSEFEIGSHTVTHANLVKAGNMIAYDELNNSRSFLQNEFGMNSGLTLSYPWGFYNNSVKEMAKDLYLAARTTDPGYNSYYLPDKYALKVQGFTSQTKAEEAAKWIDFSIKNRLWIIEMIHRINSEGGTQVDSSVLAEHFGYIKKHEDEIWCSNVINVIKYIDESAITDLSCELCNNTIYKIRINFSSNDQVYDQPLSIKIKIPDSWDSISTSGIGVFKIENSNNKKFISFNIVPENQLVSISPASLKTTLKETGLEVLYMSANPVINDIRLTLDVRDEQDLEISLYDLSGTTIIHEIRKHVNGVINLNFNLASMRSGFYILRVTGSKDGICVLKRIGKV